MTSVTEKPQDVSTRWWLLALTICAGVLALFTPWAVIVQLVLLGVAIFRLTRRPPRAEKIVLIVMIAILAVTLVFYGAVTISLWLLESTSSGTSIPLP